MPSGTVKALVVDRPAVGRRLGESASHGSAPNFYSIVEERRRALDSAFVSRYTTRKQQQQSQQKPAEAVLKESSTAPSELDKKVDDAAPPKRKPRAYVKDKVKSRTRELMETILAPLTRKDSASKPMRRTESQRCNGLAIVAPSSNSTTDPIIIGLQKTRSGWLAKTESAMALRKTFSQSVDQTEFKKNSPKRLSFMDENGKLRLPFLSDRKPRPQSAREASPVKSDVSRLSSIRDRTGRVMQSVMNGPFSNRASPAELERKQSKAKLTISPPIAVSSLTDSLPSERRPVKPTASEQQLETPTLTQSSTQPQTLLSPPISVTAPTPPAVKKNLSELLSAIPPPSTPPQPTARLAVPEITTTSPDHSTSDEEVSSRRDQSSPSPLTVVHEEESAKEQRDKPPTSPKKIPGVETGSLADIVKRRPKRYFHSHTTATYDAASNETVPDASERRRLIGFLHRTSHLSLTSELSADASFYLIGHRRRQFEDSTICTESDARVFSDDESRVSTSTDNITSVSRQHNNYRTRHRRMRRQMRQPSRASSMSSMTEASTTLEVITVTLNMDSVNFLGISIVGHSAKDMDTGIYVANIMKGGAVALDGRIAPGDMILQVNDISFENFTNDRAVEVLKEAVSRRGPIKLTVAKTFDDGRQSFFSIPSQEPVRPIDMRAWIQHTNAANNLPHIPEGSEGAPTPVPGHYPGYGRAPSSSTGTSNGSGGQQTVVGPNGQIFVLPRKLDLSTDKKRVVCAMALPNSGLDIKDRTWLKIPIPMSFLGSDLVNWLVEHVEGLADRKDAKKYATELLKCGLVTHMVNSNKFSEQSYYMIGHECADVVRLRQCDESASRSDVASLPAPPPHLPPQPWTANSAMTSDYVPISPFPVPQYFTRANDLFSQVSGESSGSERLRRPKAILPPAPSTITYVPYNNAAQFFRQQSARFDEYPRAPSRTNFHIAHGNLVSEEMFIDNL